MTVFFFFSLYLSAINTILTQRYNTVGIYVSAPPSLYTVHVQTLLRRSSSVDALRLDLDSACDRFASMDGA